MEYNFFLFTKLHELCFNSELEYDLLFEELITLYEDWKGWDSNFGAVYTTYESMEQFLLEVKVN